MKWHQWFGDLVDEVVGRHLAQRRFATWMESKPVAKWKPEWNYPLDDVSGTSGTQHRFAVLRAIHRPLRLRQIQGCLWNRLRQAASGCACWNPISAKQTFRTGVNAYIKAPVRQCNRRRLLGRGQDVEEARRQIMPTFEATGRSILNVKAQCAGNSTSVTVSQQRYYIDRAKFEEPNDQRWQIPLCMRGSAVVTPRSAN
jgi:aminopeptidase N/puromycin-sensitive aminopeptidase